jgi:hypothetical protein
MKKPNFNYNKNNRDENIRSKIPEFSQNKLDANSEEVIGLFKLIQAVRYERIRVQDEHNECRRELINKRMDLESEIIKIKKSYNNRITSLQEEFNSVKLDTKKELAKLRAS